MIRITIRFIGNCNYSLKSMLVDMSCFFLYEVAYVLAEIINIWFTWQTIGIDIILLEYAWIKIKCLRTMKSRATHPYAFMINIEYDWMWRETLSQVSPTHREVYSMQHYMIKYVSVLLQVGSVFFRVLRFFPPIKLTVMILLKYCLKLQ